MLKVAVFVILWYSFIQNKYVNQFEFIRPRQLVPLLKSIYDFEKLLLDVNRLKIRKFTTKCQI